MYPNRKEFQVDSDCGGGGGARRMFDGFPKFIKSERFGGLYKGLGPLWERQIPCKF
ncbi:hypothetical protein AALP_AAs42443U000100 [Arabis alpina]|uniref:Uncharacterized protein n=1 Tax=Arabis alpina TaxID=50452 RepID=A0A087FX19_ARAAL|nr:hypothetical protein AALP_AAs42443U000100 [Arabis alpina]